MFRVRRNLIYDNLIQDSYLCLDSSLICATLQKILSKFWFGGYFLCAYTCAFNALFPQSGTEVCWLCEKLAPWPVSLGWQNKRKLTFEKTAIFPPPNAKIITLLFRYLVTVIILAAKLHYLKLLHRVLGTGKLLDYNCLKCQNKAMKQQFFLK